MGKISRPMKTFYSVSMLYSCASLAYEEQETQIVDLGHMPMAVLLILFKTIWKIFQLKNEICQ